MANPINNDLPDDIIRSLNAVRLENRLTPIWLGSEAGPDGGTGGRPGGYIGKLSQINVAYDTTEAATLSTSGSGSLLDNLNHIRYRVQAVENILGSGGGSFLGLTDVGPESYAGYAGYIVSVNDEEDGLEFITMSDGGSSSFLELTDTPSTYAGEAGKAAVVNDAENALEFVEILTETDVSANMLVNSNFILSLSSDNSPVYWEIDLGSGAQAYADYGYAASDFTYEGPLLTIWPSSSEVTRVSQKVHVRTGLNTPAPFQNWFGSAGRVKFGAMVRAYWFGGGAPPPNAVRLFATNGVSTNYSSYVMDDGEWHFVTVNAPLMFTHTNYEFGIEAADVTDDYGIYVTNAIVTMRDLVDGEPYWVAHSQDFNNVLHLPDFDDDPATPPANTQILYSKGGDFYKMNSAGETVMLGSGGGGGGVSNFIDLDDTPASYTNQSYNSVMVDSSESSLIFVPSLGIPARNETGGTVTAGTVGYLSTSTTYGMIFTLSEASGGVPCAVIVGGENDETITVVRSGSVILNYSGTAPSLGKRLEISTNYDGTVVRLEYDSTAGWYPSDAMTPELFAIATDDGSGGQVRAVLMTNRITQPFISEYDLLRINSTDTHQAATGWSGTINESPVASPITVSTSTGSLASITPAASNQLGKIILRNTSKSHTEAYITAVSGSSISATGVWGTWANGDSITTIGRPTSGINNMRGVYLGFSNIPELTTMLGLTLLYKDSAITGVNTLLLHPYTEFANSKSVYIEPQVANQWFRVSFPLPVINRRILIGNISAGTADLIVRVNSVTVAAP